MHPETLRFSAHRRCAQAERKRLLLLSTDMGMGGGAEEQVIQIAVALQARGWDVLIVSMLPQSPMPKDFDRYEIPLVNLGMRRGIPDPRSIFKLARLIRDFRPDVVHSHMVQANLLARAVHAIQPYPVLVCTLHALTMKGMERDRSRVFEAAHRLTDRLADCTTAICHAASDYYVQCRAVPASKMRVVPNGIDTRRFQHNPAARSRLRREWGCDDQFVWLAVGRLEPVKAYPTLLRAFALLGSGPRTLMICGIGSVADSLHALTVELGISERVKFLGLRDDIPDVMSAADAFAISSDSEGLPLVLLQASAAGLPIVATNVGGNAEVAVDGVNGYLVPPGAPAAFAQSMALMMSLSVSDRGAMGERGRARVAQHFDAEQVFDSWECLYAELLEQGRLQPTAQPVPV